MDILSKCHSTVVVGTAMAAVALTVVLLASDSISDWIVDEIWVLGELGQPVSSSLSHIGPELPALAPALPVRQDWPDFGDLDSFSTTQAEKIFRSSLLDSGRTASICLALLWSVPVRPRSPTSGFQCWICIAIFTTSPRRTAGGELNNSSLGNVTFSSAKGRL